MSPGNSSGSYYLKQRVEWVIMKEANDIRCKIGHDHSICLPIGWKNEHLKFPSHFAPENLQIELEN